MSDDTIRYLADWAGLVLLTGMALAGFLVFVALAVSMAKSKK